MKKEELIIEGLYNIKKQDLKRCAQVAALSFLDDESSKFLLSGDLTYKSLYNYYLVLYKAAFDKMHMFAQSDNIDSFIIITPIQNAEITIWECIKAGALKLIFSYGLGMVFRSLIYEKNCIKTRNKLAPKEWWYIFQFGVLPDKQGKKLGSKTIKPILNWLDSKKINCYLETQKIINVNIYTHFGFRLKTTASLPDKKASQFAMIRNYQNF